MLTGIKSVFVAVTEEGREEPSAALGYALSLAKQANAHLIVEADDRRTLGCGMKAIAGRLARAVNRITGRRGPVLADRYHVRLLATPKEVRNALRYVLLNARRHARAAAANLSGAARLDPVDALRYE